jgi:hypothetical protein
MHSGAVVVCSHVRSQSSDQVLRQAMNTDFLAIPDWFSYENAGAGIAVADLNADGFPDLVVLSG